MKNLSFNFSVKQDREIDSISRDVIQGRHTNFVCDNNDIFFCLHKNNMVPFRVNTVLIFFVWPQNEGKWRHTNAVYL